MEKRKLVILTGPTAVGKTKLSIELAKRIGGEIISADSAQVYKHMDIGSAKITPEEMEDIPHYLIDEFEPKEEFNVVVFQQKTKQYMEDIVEKAKQDGYVTTLLNRKRYVEELSSPTYMIREFGKRVAMNTPIQGTAADIIKIAMIKVYKMLKEKQLKTKMIMQVHDELIFEVPKEELEVVIPLISKEMETALELEVDLKVEYGYGSNWFNTK